MTITMEIVGNLTFAHCISICCEVLYVCEAFSFRIDWVEFPETGFRKLSIESKALTFPKTS